MSDALSSFSFPTRIEYGAGAIRLLPDWLPSLGVRRPLVVTDPGLASTPAFAGIRSQLEESGLEWYLYAGVHGNPVEADVQEARDVFQEQDCDGVVGIGGGSPLDVAKAVRLLIKRPQLNLAEFDWEADWTGLVPFVAVPTTAGTGSEVGRSAVITPRGSKRKAVLFHPELLAALAILDPELTVGLPPGLTAATGADALTHCIESFTSPVFNPLCDGIALEGVRLIRAALPKVMKDPGDLTARGRLLVAAAMGGIAFQKDLGAAHSLAHPLSTHHGVHHGLANALCLPTVMAFNAQRLPGCYRQVALALGEDVISATDAIADEAAVNAVTRLFRELGIPEGLRSQGIEEDALAVLAGEAFADPCHQTNPVPVTTEDLFSLYQSAL